MRRVSAVLRTEKISNDIIYMYSTVDHYGVQAYKVEIIAVYDKTQENKDFLVKVVDADLLKKTGGIVSGMSGSPIVQDGKLVGAVTHVLVNDPTKGYGILIENMILQTE